LSNDLFELIDELNHIMDEEEQPFIYGHCDDCDEDCDDCLSEVCDSEDFGKEKEKRCQCGSASLGSPRHSYWCCMYEEDQ
jgi:hypothetical protein